MISFKTGEDFYNKIYLHFNALIAITLVPFGILLLDIQSQSDVEPILQHEFISSMFTGFVFVSGGLCIYKGLTNYKTHLLSVEKKLPLRIKLEKYYSYSLQKYFWLTGACALSFVALLLTRSSIMIPVYVLCLVLLSIGRPTLRDMIEKMKVSAEDTKILYDKLEID